VLHIVHGNWLKHRRADARRSTVTEAMEGHTSVSDDHAEHHGPDPLIGELDALGLYPPSRAAAASKWTTTIGDPDNSSRLDD
jgi:hypothetical protein